MNTQITQGTSAAHTVPVLPKRSGLSRNCHCLLAGLGLAAVLLASSPAMAQVLGTAGNFAVLGATPSVANTGPTIVTGSVGVFRLVSRAMAQAEGFGSFVDYANDSSSRAPVQMAGSPVPKIREGALCLNDPAEAHQYLAVFSVGRTLNLSQSQALA